MHNIFIIAKREFLATVGTKAFIIGLFILPVMIAVFALLGPVLFAPKNFELKGEVTIIDPTGRVAPELKKYFDPAKIKARREEEARKALAKAPPPLRKVAGKSMNTTVGNILGQIPEMHILEKPADSDLQLVKKWLIIQPKEMPRLAVVVIHKDAVELTNPGKGYGSYDLYVKPKLDDRASSEIRRGLQEAIINIRAQARSLDKAAIDAFLNFPNTPSVTVTETEQRQSVPEMNFLIPVAFGFLLLIGVMGGGGQLLNSTVEEKSSRVVEVLLSAVSPMELMAGKILGQMGVSLIGMGFYVLMGIALLAGFALFGLLDLSLIIYLVIFFIITYLVLGSLMMSIGAAVNDMKEAQSLMMPLTMVLMVPWILWMPISRDPNSTLSVAMSFLPPFNSFAMLLRMTSNTPPPLWQVWISIAVGIGSAYCAIWFAAKVFRVGILMYGKPPNFATLIRWVRQS
jgi:ABC-2 type transport system permease protein